MYYYVDISLAQNIDRKCSCEKKNLFLNGFNIEFQRVSIIIKN